jgi:phosphatidylserine/phosphatidylglycerophosphate/cardiolipin synthase-like enzyme
MGLASLDIKPADNVTRFWNCHTAMIVRPSGSSDGAHVLVGRANIAEPYDQRRQDDPEPAAKEEVLITNTPVKD